MARLVAALFALTRTITLPVGEEVATSATPSPLKSPIALLLPVAAE